MGLKQRQESCKKTLNRLIEAYGKTDRHDRDYEIFRDSVIQRFEITVESFWKYIKVFLSEKEGVICNSPKGCIREMFLGEYIAEDVLSVFMSMIDDRNLISHTYNEELADEIFDRVGEYIEILHNVCSAK